MTPAEIKRHARKLTTLHNRQIREEFIEGQLLGMHTLPVDTFMRADERVRKWADRRVYDQRPAQPWRHR